VPRVRFAPRVGGWLGARPGAGPRDIRRARGTRGASSAFRCQPCLADGTAPRRPARSSSSRDAAPATEADERHSFGRSPRSGAGDANRPAAGSRNNAWHDARSPHDTAAQPPNRRRLERGGCPGWVRGGAARSRAARTARRRPVSECGHEPELADRSRRPGRIIARRRALALALALARRAAARAADGATVAPPVTDASRRAIRGGRGSIRGAGTVG
jgi:hypothetical protein